MKKYATVQDLAASIAAGQFTESELRDLNEAIVSALRSQQEQKGQEMVDRLKRGDVARVALEGVRPAYLRGVRVVILSRAPGRSPKFRVEVHPDDVARVRALSKGKFVDARFVAPAAMLEWVESEKVEPSERVSESIMAATSGGKRRVR